MDTDKHGLWRELKPRPEAALLDKPAAVPPGARDSVRSIDRVGIQRSTSSASGGGTPGRP